MTSAFKSKTKRGKKLCEEYLASCGYYNITEPFRKHVSRCSHRKSSRYDFNFSNKRFGKITDFKVANIDMGIPGPGIYNISSYKPGKECNVGRLPDFASRSKFKPSDTPAPCDYTVHPLYASSVLKSTFNITLGNPVPRYGPMPDWRAKVRPIKILRPFLMERFKDEEEQKVYEKQVLAVAKVLDEELVWNPKFGSKYYYE